MSQLDNISNLSNIFVQQVDTIVELVFFFAFPKQWKSVTNDNYQYSVTNVLKHFLTTETYGLHIHTVLPTSFPVNMG